MWKCPNEHKPLEFVVPFIDPELCVLVYPDGSSTNRWADGVRGVDISLQKDAEDCEYAYCPICCEEADWTKE